MEKKKISFFSARNIAFLAVLLALVIVLQAFGLVIPLPTGTSISFVLVPIVLGGILVGPIAGAILGLAFGIVTLFDAMTLALMNLAPVVTVFTVLLKGLCAGLVPSLIYKLLKDKIKKDKYNYVATFVASALAPICNTGIFIIGTFCMKDAVLAYLGDFPFDTFMVSIVLINFCIELAVSLILAPALVTVDRVVEKRIITRKQAKAAEPQSEGSNDNLS